MGKRSDFERMPRDYYRTPVAAVVPLMPHLIGEWDFVEPCAGDGALIDAIHFLRGPVCANAYDIEPQRNDIRQADMFSVPTIPDRLYIANPPWRRDILHPLIEHLTSAPGSRAWMLFDAEWMHTKQSIPFLPRLRKIVSIGRVKWIPDSKMTGKDSACWYYFTGPSSIPPLFYGRTQ